MEKKGSTIVLQGELDRRSILTGIGAICCLSALFLAPLAASPGVPSRDADRVLSDLQRLPPAPPTLPRERQLVVSRDPFAEPPAIAARLNSLRSSQAAGMVIRVEGIIGGDRPRALVRVGADERIVAIGESIDGIRIVGIDDAGIRLTSGVRLPLDAGDRP